MRVFTSAATAVALTLAAPAAFAQPVTGTVSENNLTYVGSTPSSPGCPAERLHILRANGILSGVVFYADGSGVSKISGKSNGKTFRWVQTSISGHGPSGTVTGTVSDEGAMDIHLGGTCELKTTLPRYNDVLSRGG